MLPRTSKMSRLPRLRLPNQTRQQQQQQQQELSPLHLHPLLWLRLERRKLSTIGMRVRMLVAEEDFLKAEAKKGTGANDDEEFGG